MKSQDRSKLQAVLSEQGYGGASYRELQVKLEDCPDVPTAVGVCVDENYRSLAVALRKSFGLDKNVGGYGTVAYRFVFTPAEGELLSAYRLALLHKDELNPAPFADEMRDINKNHEAALESLMRKLTRG